MKVLIDTCVVVDALQKREPFCDEAMEIILAISNDKLTGVVTAKSLTDIYYLSRKSLHSESAARDVVGKLFTIFEVADTYAEDCRNAIASPMNYYEDAVMVQTAKRIGANHIVTRNQKDYRLSEVSVLSPKELLSLIGTEER